MLREVQDKIRANLSRANIDAYIPYTPSNFQYVTGHQSRFLSAFWRWHGSQMAVLPADPSITGAMVVNDFEEETAKLAAQMPDVRSYKTWIETRDLDVITGEAPSEADFTRPHSYDPDDLYRHVRDILMERGLGNATIGTDMRFISHETLTQLQRSMPECTFVDFTEEMYRIRCIKLPDELKTIRIATRVMEEGVKYALNEIREGMPGTDVRYLYEIGVAKAVLEDPNINNYQGTWGLVTVGTGVKAGFGDVTPVTKGSIVKFDCGAILGGYISDAGRTYVMGRPDETQRRIYGALRSGFERILDMLKPGVKMSEVFLVAQNEVRSHGFPRYTRGHFGHSIGLDSWVEEPPAFSAHEDTLLEPGMVLAVETPYYGASVGSYCIEDMVVITNDGHENLNTLSYDLIEL